MVEIFSQSYRPSAFLIVGCINWMGLFVLGMIFPVIVVSDSQRIPLSRLMCFWMPTRGKIITINCNDMQSLALCPNTKPAQKFPRSSNWTQVKHGQWELLVWYLSWIVYWAHLWIWTSKAQACTKGQGNRNKFLIFLTLSCFSACRIILDPSASLSFWEPLLYQQFSSTCIFLRPRESQ